MAQECGRRGVRVASGRAGHVKLLLRPNAFKGPHLDVYVDATVLL